MGSFILDQTHWPLALTIAQEKLTFEQHIDSLKGWDTWFEKNESFYVIRFYADKASLEQAVGVGKATQEWMKEGADLKFRTLVKSMLIIVPSDQYPRMKRMNVSKVFGIPGGIFPSTEAAFDWLEKSSEILDLSSFEDGWKEAVKQKLEAS